MSRLRIAGKIFGILCFFGAITTVAVGIHHVSKHNAEAKTYWERETMYDGPWLPVEFGLLGMGMVAYKFGDPDWNEVKK